MFFADVKGGDELRRALKARMGLFMAAMDKILPEEAQLLRQAADAKAPALSGELRSSSEVSSEKTRTQGTRAAVAYLDEKAAAVHEGIHYGHHLKGTKGFKWLENATNEFQTGFVQRVAAKLRAVIGGGS